MKILHFGLIIASLSFYGYGLPSGDRKEARHRDIQNIFQSLNIEASTKCTICKDVVNFLHGVGSDIGEQELISVATYLCKKIKLVTNRVCVSGVKEFAHEVWTIFIDAFVVPEKICGLILGDRCLHFHNYFSSWNITIPERRQGFEILDPWNSKLQTAATYKFLQVSDIHLDNDYMEGSNAVCNEPLCCRKQDGKAGKGQVAAPEWGYPGKCDSNIKMVTNLFEQLVQEHSDIDYIIWTGDVPPHNEWNQTRKDQVNAIKQSTKLFKEYFPNKIVYPTLGNHEGAPVNSFPPEFVTGEDSGQWLRDAIADDWGTWLPEDTKETLRKGGYYTVLVKKGFRIISLNMNYGSPGNWWLWINSTDPAGQLQWLVSVLLKAEEAGEKVHIIGHIPPDATLKWFNFNYFKIIDRFYDTITGQFFGHTHHDEFRVFYDAKTYKIPNNIAYIGPSVTTYHYLNPGYRLYDVDGGAANSTWTVTDHHTYILNLAKIEKTPVWELEYSAKAAYGMLSLTPADWSALVYRMAKNDALFQIFYRAFTKQYVRGTCTGACKHNYLCSMNTALDGGFHNFCEFNTTKDLHMYTLWRAETYNKC